MGARHRAIANIGDGSFPSAGQAILVVDAFNTVSGVDVLN